MQNYLETKSKAFDQSDRAVAVQLMIRLHSDKNYMEETIFIAVGIFDRYTKAIGPENLSFDHMIPLATTCILMSAKL